MIATNDSRLEEYVEKMKVMTQRIERLQKFKCENEFWLEELESENKLIAAEKVYQEKLKNDFWQGDMQSFPIGQVQTLF